MPRRSHVQHARGMQTRDAIVAAIGVFGDPDSMQIAHAVGMSHGTVMRHLRSLRADGTIRYAQKRINDAFYTNRYEVNTTGVKPTPKPSVVTTVHFLTRSHT